MTNKSTATIAVVLLLVSLAGLQAVELAEANPLSSYFKNEPILGISSPVSRHSAHSSYSNPVLCPKPSFNISFFYELPKNFTQIDSFSYKIDDNPPNSLNFTIEDGFFNYTKYSVCEPVDNLSDGIYNLKVYALFVNGTTWQVMDSTVKIGTVTTNPLFSLPVASVILMIFVLSAMIFYGRTFIKNIKRNLLTSKQVDHP
ncbi:MAG: hypothetical protein NWE95_01635 [Candidatus Bathyarchaeota archaeon]|nr:hypothetical protein [Candidatus Bathyarchaeota archaeon]